MGIGTNPDYDETFAAALEWWREAGVDTAFLDEPRSWLPPAAEQPRPDDRDATLASSGPVASFTPTPIEPAAALPTEFTAFRDWWMSTPELDGGRVSGRVAPRGAPDPELMIITPMPESGDDKHLLSGPEGQLLDLFLASTGLVEGTVYRASVLPCHSPGADWSPERNHFAAQAVVRHASLVQPKKLLVIGFNILPLLGHRLAQGPAVSSVFKHEGVTIPMLAVRRIPTAASQPRWKSVLWRAWLEWTA